METRRAVRLVAPDGPPRRAVHRAQVGRTGPAGKVRVAVPQPARVTVRVEMLVAREMPPASALETAEIAVET